jgi:hypothetical protein
MPWITSGVPVVIDVLSICVDIIIDKIINKIETDEHNDLPWSEKKTLIGDAGLMVGYRYITNRKMRRKWVKNWHSLEPTSSVVVRHCYTNLAKTNQTTLCDNDI